MTGEVEAEAAGDRWDGGVYGIRSMGSDVFVVVIRR